MVSRNTAGPAGATTISCLSSSTAFATAASGTGLLDMDGDECLVNSVKIRGQFFNTAVLDLDTAGNTDSIVRKIVVWFNKPLLVASAAGTLPPVTEVLISDAPSSLFVTSASNGGRFTVLSDKTWTLGQNTFQSAIAAGGAVTNGRNNIIYDYTVKVNKSVKFKAPAVSGGGAGHYDSDVASGQIDRGVLVMYTLYSTAAASGAALTDNSNTRLNFTG